MTNTKALSVVTTILGLTFASGIGVAATAERIPKEAEVSVSFPSLQRSDLTNDTLSSNTREDARGKPAPEVYYHTEDANRDNVDRSEPKARKETTTF